MTVGILLGALVGLGLVGLVRGLSASPPSLEVLAAALDRPVDVREPPTGRLRADRHDRLGAELIVRIESSRLAGHPRWSDLGHALR